MAPESTPCPGCSAPMELDQEVCAACRRPRDEREIQAGYDRIREREEMRRRRPRKLAAWALAAIAAALAFRNRAAFIAAFASRRAELSREIEKAQDPGPETPKTAAGAAAVAMLGGPPPRAAATAAAAKAVPRSFYTRAEPPAPPAPPAAPAPPKRATRPAEPAPAEDSQLVVYGVVYDMKTAAPVALATVRFHRKSSPVTPVDPAVVTDGEGHYKLTLDRAMLDAGLVASVSAEGYRPGQIEDTDPSYLERPEADRLEALAEAAPGDLEDVPVLFPPSARTVPLDLLLLPEASAAPK